MELEAAHSVSGSWWESAESRTVSASHRMLSWRDQSLTPRAVVGAGGHGELGGVKGGEVGRGGGRKKEQVRSVGGAVEFVGAQRGWAGRTVRVGGSHVRAPQPLRLPRLAGRGSPVPDAMIRRRQ